MTFQPHPRASFGARRPSVLCDPLERAARLAELGVDHLVVERFDATLAAQSAEDFVGPPAGRATLGRAGHDRRLGLRPRAWRQPGLDAGPRRPRWLRCRPGRSARQPGRRHLEQSDPRRRGGWPLAEAARLLGRRYAVTGTVVHGDARGRTLGFPTANLAFEAPVALPPDGIYAVRVSWGGDPLQPERRADGVASLGVRPTFGHGSRVLEVFLLDFDEDLYDVRLRVEFVRRQRGERRFTSVEGLVDQMQRDVARARAVLAAARP